MGISSKAIILLYLIVYLLNKLDASNESCQTPSGTNGICVYIGDCPTFVNKLLVRAENLTQKERQYVRDSSCKLNNSILSICCPSIDESDLRPIQFPHSTDNELLPQPPKCGHILNKNNPNGQFANLNEYPWIALIEYSNDDNQKTHFCSGTLINKRYVLTAAHCIIRAPENWNLTAVRLGEWDTTTNPDCTQNICAEPYIDYDIESVITHPKFMIGSYEGNDIALLRLAKDVTFSNSIQPICLPTLQSQQNDYYVDRIMETTGWKTAEGASSKKQKAKANVWSLANCTQRYNVYKLALSPNQICSSGINNDDSCQGDSGGPLMIQETFGTESGYVVAGIVSFGPVSCSVSNWPNVYTRVGAYIDWITSVIQN